jgi:hypothetical protein
MSTPASQVYAALANADYPATSSELVSAAEERGAPADVLCQPETLEAEEYESTAAVLAELGEDDDEADEEDEYEL